MYIKETVLLDYDIIRIILYEWCMTHVLCSTLKARALAWPVATTWPG